MQKKYHPPMNQSLIAADDGFELFEVVACVTVVQPLMLSCRASASCEGVGHGARVPCIYDSAILPKILSVKWAPFSLQLLLIFHYLSNWPTCFSVSRSHISLFNSAVLSLKSNLPQPLTHLSFLICTYYNTIVHYLVCLSLVLHC